MATKNNDEEVKNHRRRCGDVVEETGKRLPPIEGFENVPLVSVEESVKPLEGLVRRVTEYAEEAKRKAIAHPTNDNVTLDESAAIRLYTMEWKKTDGGSVYTVMNTCLRDKERTKMQPWYLYLKLLLTALFKLPSVSGEAYRGVKMTIYQDYLGKKGTVWWAFSSCTKTMQVLEKETFFGKTGERTLFLLRCSDARDIKAYSAYSDEDEVLVLPGTYFKINGHLDSGNGLHIITLEETQSDVYFSARKLFAKPHAPAKQPYQPKATSPPPPQIIQPKSTPPPPQVVQPSWEPKPIPRQGGRAPVKPPSADRRRKLEERISRCPSRDTVEFRRLELTDAEMADISDQVIRDKECTRLILSDNNIRADGLVELAKAAKGSQTLIELNLARNHLIDDDVRALAEELTIHDTLEDKPSGCPCPWSSTKTPVAVGGALQVLNLAENDIGDPGVEELANMLTTRRTLTELKLSKNRITDRGVKHLATTLSKPDARLKKLYLDGNSLITAKSIGDFTRMLKGNTSLETLWLTSCGFTSDAQHQLEKVVESRKGFYLRIDSV